MLQQQVQSTSTVIATRESTFYQPIHDSIRSRLSHRAAKEQGGTGRQVASDGYIVYTDVAGDRLEPPSYQTHTSPRRSQSS